MRLFLILLLFVAPVLWIAGIAFVIWRLRIVSAADLRIVDVMTVFGSVATILSLVVGSVALYAAFRTIQLSNDAGVKQQENFKTQSAILNGQSKALSDSVDELRKVQRTLDAARTATESQLALLKAEREEELARQKRRPDLEISFGPSLIHEAHGGRLDLNQNEQATLLTIMVSNVGDGALTAPLILFGSPNSPNVTFEPTQIVDPQIKVWPPYSLVPHTYRFVTTVTIPADVQRFTLEISISGETYSHVFKIPIDVRRLGGDTLDEVVERANEE